MRTTAITAALVVSLAGLAAAAPLEELAGSVPPSVSLKTADSVSQSVPPAVKATPEYPIAGTAQIISAPDGLHRVYRVESGLYKGKYHAGGVLDKKTRAYYPPSNDGAGGYITPAGPAGVVISGRQADENGTADRYRCACGRKDGCRLESKPYRRGAEYGPTGCTSNAFVLKLVKDQCSAPATAAAGFEMLLCRQSSGGGSSGGNGAGGGGNNGPCYGPDCDDDGGPDGGGSGGNHNGPDSDDDGSGNSHNNGGDDGPDDDYDGGGC
ncbi:MAG: hypothetical protein PHP45_10000 [Elusimicrobiales bacterium]|nr:hypothetical protein [Elusimicrobiales bacterium]